MTLKTTRTSGFTLVEIMIVVAIIGLLARRMLGFKPQHLWQNYLPEGRRQKY